MASERITVEVAGKFGPKANGKWYGIRKPMSASDFVTGGVYDVETSPWEKNGKSGVNIVKAVKVTGDSAPKAEAVSAARPEANNDDDRSLYGKAKDIRILRSGVYQAAAKSPLLASMPASTIGEAVALVREFAEAIIKEIEG